MICADGTPADRGSEALSQKIQVPRKALIVSLLEGFENGFRGDSAATQRHFFAPQTHTRAGPSAALTRRLKALALENRPPAPEAPRGALRLLRHANLGAETASPGCPHQVPSDRNEARVPRAVANALRRRHPASRVEIIPGTGHRAFLSHAILRREALSAFLEPDTLADGGRLQ